MGYTWTRGATRTDDGRAVLDPASVAPALAVAAAVSPQAAAAMTQQRAQAGAILVDLYRYLAAHAERHPTLVSALPAMRAAVAEYRAAMSPDPLNGARTVYAAIQGARRTDPALPDP